MASADLKRIMAFRGRRGPSGRLWLEADRAGRRFVLFEGRDGWVLFERVNPTLTGAKPGRGARVNAPPPPPVRKPSRRVRRELIDLGLVQKGDEFEEGQR